MNSRIKAGFWKLYEEILAFLIYVTHSCKEFERRQFSDRQILDQNFIYYNYLNFIKECGKFKIS